MMLNVGQKIQVTIQDIAFGGEGVARVEDFVVFVPFVLEGEDVEVEVTEVKKRFARARLLEVTKASGDRVKAPCPYFGVCGGCQYQHIAYTTQLRLKHKQVSDLLQRIGGIAEAAVDPIVPCPQPYGYRNRVMVRSQWDKFKQGLNIGFIRYDNRLVVDIEQCLIAEPGLNEQLKQVRANPPPKGGLKVVLRTLPPDWEVPPDSFFQNNFHVLPKLVEVARERVRSSGVRYLFDIYCGVGFFALELADLVEAFVGIELDVRAIKAARLNATRRGRGNGEFIAGTAEEQLPGLLGRYPASQSAVILDPPRRGCARSILELLREMRPARVLYLSCHPATLARDVKLLTEGGLYAVGRVTPFDMFPQTQHVECLAELDLASHWS
jgi:tRNA/tmRNA/rRNA uracil-C5-methylase (TrmA/RlmC/RlmD family)